MLKFKNNSTETSKLFNWKKLLKYTKDILSYFLPKTDIALKSIMINLRKLLRNFFLFIRYHFLEISKTVRLVPF